MQYIVDSSGIVSCEKGWGLECGSAALPCLRTMVVRPYFCEMQFIAAGTWAIHYPDPIILRKGDRVALGELDSGNPDWPGWIWAANATHTGWIPVQVVEQFGDGEGRILEDYSAQELEVLRGDVLVEIKRLNGWIWALSERTGMEGWAPLEVLVEIRD